VEEQFPGELQTLRADNVRLRRLLALSEEQARAADPDQATLTGAPTAPVDMRSVPSLLDSAPPRFSPAAALKRPSKRWHLFMHN
jgi:hypothetical protein